MATTITTLQALQRKSVDCIFVKPVPFSTYQERVGRTKRVQDYVTQVVNVVEPTRCMLKERGVLILYLTDERQSSSLLGIPFRIVTKMLDTGWCMHLNLVWSEHQTVEARPLDHITFFSPTGQDPFHEYGNLAAIRLTSLNDLLESLLVTTCPEGGTVLEMYPQDTAVQTAATTVNLNHIGLVRR